MGILGETTTVGKNVVGFCGILDWFLEFFVENRSIFDAFCQLFVLPKASMRNIKYTEVLLGM